MSLLILPSRALLKPDRHIIRPGWDDAPEHRPRGRWWRKLLAGAAGNTRLQPGSCCGCVSLAHCGGACDVPKTNLTFSLTSSGPAAAIPSGTLVWTPTSGTVWLYGVGGNPQITLQCSSSNPPFLRIDYFCLGSPNFCIYQPDSVTCGSGFTATFTITDSNPADGACYVISSCTGYGTLTVSA